MSKDTCIIDIDYLGYTTCIGLPTHLTKAKSVTLSDLFRYAVDITTPPRKALLRLLADYTSDPQEKNQLMYLCSKQGKLGHFIICKP